MTDILTITRTDPHLNWLPRNGGNRVPSEVVQRLKDISGIKDAQDFMYGAGLTVIDNCTRASESAYALKLPAPGGIDEYFGPQVVLANIDCAEIPIGSALMNFLLPPIQGWEQAENVFWQYQSTVRAFCRKMESTPFACITGQKTDKIPPHDLFCRGFRFFFSPEPNLLFDRIMTLLTIGEILFSDASVEEKREAAKKTQNLKFAITTDWKTIGHSILEDIKLYSSGTTLVDLR